MVNFYTTLVPSDNVEDSVKIGTMSDGKLTGEASCLFETPEDCQQAHQNKN